MADSVAGVVLAAGAGTRLRPLTLLRPKPLCPLGDRPLVDHALASVGAVADDLAVNLHHGRDLLEEHLVGWSQRSERGLHLSIEAERPLGTAGALGHLRRWLDGRDVVVANGDTWHLADLAVLTDGWDGERVRVLTTSAGPFGPRSAVVASLLPWRQVGALGDEPSGLWEVLWGPEAEAGRLETLHTDAEVWDCGTPARYLAANLAWSRRFGDGGSVIGEGAVVEGSVLRCVVWPGSRVERGEHLVDAIRADGLTVAVR